MRGRKPTPTHVKLVTGNPGKRKLNEKEPKSKRRIPSPPDHLSRGALVAWGMYSEQLDRMGVLTEADTGKLMLLCETHAEVVTLLKDMEKRGKWQRVKTKSGGYMERQRPMVAQFNEARRQLRALQADFGLDPTTRPRLKRVEDGDERDPAEAYFG